MARGLGKNGASAAMDAQFAGGKQLDPEGMSLLDQAADYTDEHSLHEGSVTLQEREPGEFWSIETRNVHKAFGRSKILEGLDLGIPEGMVTVVLGPSGTGKSVLIKHIIGLLFPDKGEVMVHGESLSQDDDERACSRSARSSASSSRTARCSARCRSTTTSRSRCASTRTSARARSPRSSTPACPTSASPTPRAACPTSFPAACASAPDSPARWCSSPRS